MGGNRCPAACHGVCAGAVLDCLRPVSASVCAEELIADRVKSGNRCVYRIDSVMISALSVLGLVENRGVYDFNLAGAEVSLEVLHIVVSIPETPFYIRKYGKALGCGGLVRQRQLLQLTVVIHRDKGEQGCLQAVLCGGEAAVADTVAAFVAVKFGLGRLPAGIPDRVAILYVEIFAVAVGRHIVVTVTGQAQQLGILIEGIAAAGVGNKTEELVAAQVVDPGERSLRGSDYIFLICIIKKPKFHSFLLVVNFYTVTRLQKTEND